MNRRVWYVVLLGCLLGLALAGVATGSDQPTIIYPEHEERVASPGETVEMNVFVDSDGGYGDAGVANITMNASFETEYLHATAVEPASYLEQGESTEVHEETDIDNEAGTAVAKQWRDPPRGGSTGRHLFATVTFEIDDSAPETNTTVSFVNSSAELVENHPVFVYEHNATVVIEGDASQEQPPADDGSSTGESGGEDSTGEGGGPPGTEQNGAATGNDDAVPAIDRFGTGTVAIVGGVVALLAGLAVVVRRTGSNGK